MHRIQPSRRARAFNSIPVGAGVLVALVASGTLMPTAAADGPTLKPGLWEVRLVRQVVNGQDVSQQLTEALAKAQAALAKLSPEARATVQGMLNETAPRPGDNESFRICVTPEMAAKDLPPLDRDDSCRPTLLSRSGNRVSFRIDCSAGGRHVQGQGDATREGDTISTRTDTVIRNGDGSTLSMHNETQMQFISSQCGAHSPPN